jgi:lipopolysaccharide/colanic/teichoic acid biosynthesis glycosyltransferase
MFRICHTSFSGANFAMKRLFDLTFAAAFTAAAAVPIAIICLLIKLDSKGPILFKQRRFGYKGRAFDVYKFRTMNVDAEAMLESLKHLNEREGALFKIRNDPRITRVGKWLRRLSLDEIPQFISVWTGDMSVVGPRPLPSPVEDYGPLGIKRLNVLPGITGLWQVSGRSDLDFNQMVALDLYYLEHWSPGLDLKIILKTPAAVLSSRGAY